VRGLGHLPVVDLLERVDALAAWGEGVHEMHFGGSVVKERWSVWGPGRRAWLAGVLVETGSRSRRSASEGAVAGDALKSCRRT
jgi:hypothetical protein